MRKSWYLWLLIVFFTWSFLKSLGQIYSAISVTDYTLLASIGIGWVFYILNIPLMAIEAFTAYLLFKQKTKAIVVTKFLCIAECLNGTIMSVISMLNIEVVKSLYLASREARGMSVRHDTDFLFTPQGVGIALLVYIAFYTLLYYNLKTVKPELKN